MRRILGVLPLALVAALFACVLLAGAAFSQVGESIDDYIDSQVPGGVVQPGRDGSDGGDNANDSNAGQNGTAQAGQPGASGRPSPAPPP
ncbi:MAG TPA: hypothetical protein VM754_05995, partial [Actinomycetota bacterium]|nr:hypothetical protein [Actinomycetota bacterium]